MIKAIHVWLRPLGSVCRVRVESAGNAAWLLERLSHSFVFKTSAPIRHDGDNAPCTFQLAYTSRGALRQIEKLLGAMPEVRMMSDPA